MFFITEKIKKGLSYLGAGHVVNSELRVTSCGLNVVIKWFKIKNSFFLIVNRLLLSRITAAEVCDATGDDSSTIAGNIFILIDIRRLKLRVDFCSIRDYICQPLTDGTKIKDSTCICIHDSGLRHANEKDQVLL